MKHVALGKHSSHSPLRRHHKVLSIRYGFLPMIVRCCTLRTAVIGIAKSSNVDMYRQSHSRSMADH